MTLTKFMGLFRVAKGRRFFWSGLMMGASLFIAGQINAQKLNPADNDFPRQSPNQSVDFDQFFSVAYPLEDLNRSIIAQMSEGAYIYIFGKEFITSWLDVRVFPDGNPVVNYEYLQNSQFDIKYSMPVRTVSVLTRGIYRERVETKGVLRISTFVELHPLDSVYRFQCKTYSILIEGKSKIGPYEMDYSKLQIDEHYKVISSERIYAALNNHRPLESSATQLLSLYVRYFRDTTDARYEAKEYSVTKLDITPNEMVVGLTIYGQFTFPADPNVQSLNPLHIRNTGGKPSSSIPVFPEIVLIKVKDFQDSINRQLKENHFRFETTNIQVSGAEIFAVEHGVGLKVLLKSSVVKGSIFALGLMELNSKGVLRFSTLELTGSTIREFKEKKSPINPEELVKYLQGTIRFNLLQATANPEKPYNQLRFKPMGETRSRVALVSDGTILRFVVYREGNLKMDYNEK